MSIEATDEATLQKMARSTRSLSGGKTKLLSKVASTVKFVLRANPQTADSDDPQKRKQFHRQGSNVMRVAYVGPNGQINNRATLVPKERLDAHINLDNDEDRKLVINVLLKRPHRRYDTEILFLQKAFRDLMFFQRIEKDLDDLSFKKIFGALQLEVCDAGQKLFDYGDIGKKFYIIIEGSVYILPPTEETLLAEKESKQDPKKKSITKNILKAQDLDKKRAELSRFLTDSVKEEIKHAKIHECYPGLFVLKSIGQGEGFGELAFQGNGERKRAATIICRQRTLLGVLTYDDFQSILTSLYQRKYHDKIAFFYTVDLFQHWKGDHLACLILHMEEKKFSRNQIIFKEGDDPDFLYFIHKGQVELKKKVVEPPKIVDAEEEVVLQEKTFGRRVKLIKKPESMKLAILSPGDYFGDSGFLDFKPREHTAVICSTEAVLITISRKNFMTFIKDEQTIEVLKEHSNKKNKWHEELQSNFDHVYTKAEDNAAAAVAASLDNLKISQSLSTLNVASPKSKAKKFIINSTSKLMNNMSTQIVTREVNALDKHSEFSKTVTKLQRMHRPTLSLTKLEKSISSMERDLSNENEKQFRPKGLPFMSEKKIRKKVDDTYQKHMRRIARRLKQDRDRENQERESKEATLDGRQEQEQEQKETPEKPEKQPEFNFKPRRREAFSLNQTLSLLLKTKLSPKRTTDTSLNDIETSLNSLDRHLSHNFKVSSMTLIDNIQNKPTTTTSIIDIDKPAPSTFFKQSHSKLPSPDSRLKLGDKKFYQSLNDIDFISGHGSKRADTAAMAERTSSTNRFQNKLKKMLQVQSKPEIQKIPLMKSQLIDGKNSKLFMNSIEFNLSPKSLILNSSHARFKPTSVLQKKEV